MMIHRIQSTIYAAIILGCFFIPHILPVTVVTDLWGSADWHEREAYDMMGVKFENHPNFKRILLADDWEGHPLRKDYDTPDYYRGMPVPKDKTYWE